MGFLLHTLGYAAAATALLFVILSLGTPGHPPLPLHCGTATFLLNLNAASGLLWLSEIIEEHSRTSKLVGVRATYVSFPRTV